MSSKPKVGAVVRWKDLGGVVHEAKVIAVDAVSRVCTLKAEGEAASTGVSWGLLVDEEPTVAPRAAPTKRRPLLGRRR